MGSGEGRGVRVERRGSQSVALDMTPTPDPYFALGAGVWFGMGSALTGAREDEGTGPVPGVLGWDAEVGALPVPPTAVGGTSLARLAPARGVVSSQADLVPLL